MSKKNYFYKAIPPNANRISMELVHFSLNIKDNLLWTYCVGISFDTTFESYILQKHLCSIKIVYTVSQVITNNLIATS